MTFFTPPAAPSRASLSMTSTAPGQTPVMTFRVTDHGQPRDIEAARSLSPTDSVIAFSLGSMAGPASAATFSLYIGLTGANTAGTEFMGIAQSVAANSYVDWYGMVRLDTADFLVGGAGTATALTLEGEGEIGIA